MSPGLSFSMNGERRAPPWVTPLYCEASPKKHLCRRRRWSSSASPFGSVQGAESLSNHGHRSADLTRRPPRRPGLHPAFQRLPSSEAVLPASAGTRQNGVTRRRRSRGVIQSSGSHPCRGEMTERLMVHAWKACVGETLPRVRIPLSPPISAERSAFALLAAIRPPLEPPFILLDATSRQRGRRLARLGYCPSGRRTPLARASGAAG
jgi:hypothetical protein